MLTQPVKPKGKRKTQDPCDICFLHKMRCICASIPSLELKTKVSLVIHHRELKRTTNTGSLAHHALVNSEIFIRGKINLPLDLSAQLTSNYHSLLFYPCDEAVELTEDFINEIKRPIQLIVPDGNWRQASKVHYRHSELKHLTRVMIKAPNLDTQHLRAEHTAEGMATLQAIAYALGVIEGPDVKNELLKLYNLKLAQTLLGRASKPINSSHTE